jgi:purine-nucleoside phosphorylase
MDYGLLKEASDYVMALWPDARPTHGLILGSGWSEVVSSFVIKDEIPYHDIPGLGKTGVVGHAGKLSWATGAGLDTFIFQGRRHYYEGVGWTPIAIPPYILKTVGARSVLLTNAAGGVRKDMHCGDLMILTDHINNFGVHPLVGEHNPVWGPRFVDQTAVYNRALIALLRKAGANAKVPLLEGVYLASTGPTYETPAEVRAFARWGADAVGMSTVPEAILAHAAGLRVAGLSCITNLAAGISPAPLTHEEVTETTRQTMPLMKKVLTQFWEEMARAENA